MEYFGDPTHNMDEMFKYGLKFAYEGIDPAKFKPETEEDMRRFWAGYEYGLKLQENLPHNEIEESSQMKMSA